jgi:hypothetical protein
MTRRQGDLNRLMSLGSAVANVPSAIIVPAKPAPYLPTASGSSESPIVPKHVGEICQPAELKQTIGPCPILKEWVPGNSVA